MYALQEEPGSEAKLGSAFVWVIILLLKVSSWSFQESAKVLQ